MTILRRMTRKKTKRTLKSFSCGLRNGAAPVLEVFRHPFPPFGHRTSMRWVVLLLALAWSSAVVFVPAARGGTQSSSSSHAHDFVIFATVFTDQGFALPGAKVRVRRADEKKFRWEARSDRRGELGIRVKQGAEYEITIEARGFQPQTRKVDAREGDREDLTLRMEPLKGGKP
jgi:Carboxypeptidase regulatory-like domain